MDVQAGHPTQLDATIARSAATSEENAVRELVAVLGTEPASALLFFASPRYNFENLTKRIHDSFDAPTIGCTTAGELCIESGHCEDGLVACVIRSPSFTMRPHLISDVQSFSAARGAEEIAPLIGDANGLSFAMLLVDGLSMAEERLAAVLSAMLDGVPLAGGSAGDNLRFGKTYVAANGRAETNAAALALVKTTHSVTPFHAHHFEATDERLVITGAVPSERRVTEINGEPAALGYARAIGLSAGDLSPTVFAEHPVMLSVGGAYYVRSIQQANADQSLTFYCAIDEGLVLRIARGEDLPEKLATQHDQISKELGNAGLVITFDCILRRLEMRNRGQDDAVRSIIGRLPIIGFSTYGEQFNGLHVNQTMTGFMIGDAA